MNIQLAIITETRDSPGAQELLRAAAELGVNAHILELDDPMLIESIDTSEHIILRLSPSRYVDYVTMLKALQSNHKVTIANALRAFSKVETAVILGAAQVAIPKTTVVEPDDIQHHRQYPYIAKAEYGLGGKAVYLVSDDAEARRVADQLGESRAIIQEFIAESRGSDKRLFVVGDTVVAAMARTSDGDSFLSNLSSGGAGSSYHPTSQEAALAIEATQAFQLPFAGVDIIDSNRGPLVLEVNPSPGFAISNITGVDVARLVIQEYIGETQI